MSQPSQSIDLDPALFGDASPCFGCSPTHPIGFRLKFAREGNEVVTRFVMGQQYQGPPGIVHGGLVTTIADELAAWTVIGMKERFGFTAAIEARLKRPLRIDVETVGRGRIVRDGSRLIKVGISLSQRQRETFSGVFTFALLDRAAAERLLRGPLPKSWQSFCR